MLAVADGVVSEVTQASSVTGIHCQNLTEWNSIALAVADGSTVEYVHIAPGSAKVREGQFVKAGEVLCLSGRVGFAPEPHLHLEIHATADLKGPSLRFEFVDDLHKIYTPEAGRFYSQKGVLCVPSAVVPPILPPIVSVDSAQLNNSLA